MPDLCGLIVHFSSADAIKSGLIDYALKVELFRNQLLIIYLTVVEKSLKRPAVKPGTIVAEQGVYVQKDMQEAHVCVPSRHTITYGQRCLNNKRGVDWKLEKRGQHSLRKMNQQ